MRKLKSLVLQASAHIINNMIRLTEEQDLQECMDAMYEAFPETFDYSMEVMQHPDTYVFMSPSREYFFIAKKHSMFKFIFTFHTLKTEMRGAGLGSVYTRLCVNKIKSEFPQAKIHCSCRINNFAGVMTLVKAGFEKTDSCFISKRSIIYYKFVM